MSVILGNYFENLTEVQESLSAFAPLYKKLAQDVKGWEKVVKIAAMNCADQVNEVTCRANGVEYFPFIKVTPRVA